MNKPKFFYYPIVDADEVSKYLSEFYGEEIDVIDILFDYLGLGEINDIYIDYLVKEPEEKYRDDPWETKERWEKRKKIETYIFNEFIDWDMILIKICW